MSTPREPGVVRVWRLRRMHQQTDAVLSERADGGFDLSLRYNGREAYRRRWATREEAVADAAARRADLEREGWASHW